METGIVKLEPAFSCRAYPVSYTHLDVYKRQDVIQRGEIAKALAGVFNADTHAFFLNGVGWQPANRCVAIPGKPSIPA